MESVVPMKPLLSLLSTLQVADHTTVSGNEIWTLHGSDPLAFPTGDPAHSLAVTFRGRGLDVNLGGLGPGPVTVNFLWYKQMRVSADGVPIACRADEWGRIQAELPGKAHLLAIRFDPGWLKGLLNAALLILLGALLSILLIRRQAR